jgi:hypothetical protein
LPKRTGTAPSSAESQDRTPWFVPGDNPGYQSLLAYLPNRDFDLAVLGNEDAPGVSAALQHLTLQ